MKLAGLDFETANGKSGSICAAGIAVWEDGRITEKREWLVRPHKSMDYVPEYFSGIHGITYYDLRDVPEFPAIWQVMRNMLESADCVVIHNAPFDLRHLRAALELYALPPITFPYLCSLALTRFRLPDLPSHSLDVVAEHFGISFQHHDALEDAMACVEIAAEIGIENNLIKQFDISEY